MKQSPEQQRIVERMQPGVFCRDGFLGADGRYLTEILDADNSTVVALGVTHEQIADKLSEVLDSAVAVCGGIVEISENLTGEFIEAMGRIPCPFGDGVYHKGEVVLSDNSADKTRRFTPLSIHMIAEHGFYGGKGSPYRIEPAVICNLLEIDTEGRAG